MSVISIMNHISNVGKTTLTANIGAELARRGKNVLLIDLDPQANLTFSFITPQKWFAEFSESKTIKNWLESFEDRTYFDLKELIFTPQKVNSKVDGKLDMIASHLEIINIDLEFTMGLGGTTLKQTKRNYLDVHRRLAEGIKQIKNEYDLILIDCPSNFNIVTKMAIVASDYMLIPAKVDCLSLINISCLSKNVKALLNDYNDFVKMDDRDSDKQISPKILGIVFTMYRVYGDETILSSDRQIPFLHQCIQMAKKIGISTFTFMKNKSLFSDVQTYSVPVLIDENLQTHQDTINEIKNIVNKVEQYIR